MGAMTMAALVATLWALGKVLAASFAATADQAICALQPAGDAAALARYPRLKVAWDSGSSLGVSVDAVDGGRYLNDLQLTLEMRDVESSESPLVQSLRQSGPGQYQASTPALHRPAIAMVEMGDRIIDRFAVARKIRAGVR